MKGTQHLVGWKRIKNMMENQDVDFQVARELVRANTLFTTHTPVPAGHDAFEEHLIRAYLNHYCDIFRLIGSSLWQWEGIKFQIPKKSFQ